jgi:hypothetical protein
MRGVDVTVQQAKPKSEFCWTSSPSSQQSGEASVVMSLAGRTVSSSLLTLSRPDNSLHCHSQLYHDDEGAATMILAAQISNPD